MPESPARCMPLIRQLHALQVYILHRRDEFRASKIMQSRALANPKIEVLWSTVAEEAYGNEKGLLGGLRIRSLKDDSVKRCFLSTSPSCLLSSAACNHIGLLLEVESKRGLRGYAWQPGQRVQHLSAGE